MDGDLGEGLQRAQPRPADPTVSSRSGGQIDRPRDPTLEVAVVLGYIGREIGMKQA